MYADSNFTNPANNVGFISAPPGHQLREAAPQAPQAGEIVAFIADEGTAVEYMQPIMELVPFFGGHIIGERKYA